MILADDLFRYVVDPHPLIDVVRYIAGLFGFLVFCMGLVRFMQHILVFSAVGFMAVGLMTAAQQFEALGQPFLPWRLPLLLTANVCGAVHLYRARNIETFDDRKDVR